MSSYSIDKADGIAAATEARMLFMRKGTKEMR